MYMHRQCATHIKSQYSWHRQQSQLSEGSLLFRTIISASESLIYLRHAATRPKVSGWSVQLSG